MSNPQITTKLDSSRPFIFGRWERRYSFKSPCPPHLLPYIIDMTVETLLPKAALQQRELINVKGRDPSTFQSNLFPRALKPRGEEMLFAAGCIPAENKSDEESGFAVSLLTSFSSFVGSSGISHKTSIKREGFIPSSFPLRMLGKAFPLKIDVFRFGIDLFEPRLSGIFGYSPVVVEYLTVEVQDQSLFINITAESLKTKDSLPLQTGNLFLSLNRLVTETLHFDLLSDYMEKMKLTKNG